jgi:quercetin dioxygenase-like cupin family protein
MLLKQPGQPGGFESGMHSHATDYYAVLVQGTWIHTILGDNSAPKELKPGSYVFQPAWQVHNDRCKGPEDCIVFLYQLGKADFIPYKGNRPAEKQ